MKRVNSNIKITDREVTNQKKSIEQIKNINEAYFFDTGFRKSYHISTFGCQMNVHDSEKLAKMLVDMGYVQAAGEENADIIIYNTCCVRENAENKVYGNLGFLKHKKEQGKDFKIALCGCMMQQDSVIEKIKKNYRHVDVIFGTFNLYRFPQLLAANFDTGNLIIDIWEKQESSFDELEAERESGFKASVNIMYGCNNFCTYCIVPYVRGRERSRPKKDILEEIKNLACNGVIEVLLLGQNVNSYGNDLETEGTFAALLEEICKIDGISRVRFMTSHPKDLSDELIHVIKRNKKICRHIHLPFQAGSNHVLKAMNRKYTKEKYLELVEKIKREIPDVQLTTDIIVGFPGETDEDFEHTLDIVKKVRYSNCYMFIYSKRIGTPAAAMENQVDESASKPRFNRLLEAVNEIVLDISKSQVGRTVEVLVEEVTDSEKGIVSGRSDDNSIVHFEGSGDLIGKIVKVNIIDCRTFYLIGEVKLED